MTAIDPMSEAPRYPTIAEIQAAVVERFGLTPKDMVSARRSRCVALPRQIAMYLARELTPRSYPEIGRLFGGRDHTTVIHGCRKVEMLAEIDHEFAASVHALEAQLRNPNQLPLPLA